MEFSLERALFASNENIKDSFESRYIFVLFPSLLLLIGLGQMKEGRVCQYTTDVSSWHLWGRPVTFQGFHDIIQ